MKHLPATRFQRAGDAGLLITIEGIDGSGKTTQCAMLADWLRSQGEAVARFSEPTKGPIGEEIRRLARAGRADAQREFELFLEDREQDVRTNIMPNLEAGHIVVMDRYYISSIAYQGARGLSPAAIMEANEKIAPRPDLVILLRLPVRTALERVRSREEHGPNLFEREDYLAQVDAGFEALDWPEIRRVDSSRSAAEIHEDVKRIVAPLLDAKRSARART